MISRILKLLSGQRFPITSEAQTQAAIEAAFVDAGIDHVREARLSAHDRPDFMVGGIAIECKVKGSARSIYRQLERYAQHDTVSAIILVSNKAMGLPEEIDGKPAYFVNLARAWL